MFLSIQVRACSKNMHTTKQSVTRISWTVKRKLALSAPPKPILTDTPNLGREAKLHSDKKGNHAARDFMLKARQSMVKQDCSPIDLESYTYKTSTWLVALPKKQPWTDNDLVKLSTADQTIIKSPTFWYHLWCCSEKSAETVWVPWLPISCAWPIQILPIMEVITGWQSVQLVQNTLRCLCMTACTLKLRIHYNNRLLPSFIQKRKPSITLTFAKWTCSQTAMIVEFLQLIFATALCHRMSPAQLLFYQSKMRHHLLKWLEQGYFTIFPVRQRSRKVTVKAVQYIRTHCTCCMQSIDGIDMMECTASND